MSQGEFLFRIAGALDRSGIPYMVVGSLASALHGVPRATQDIDLVINPTAATLRQFLSMLSPEHYYVDGKTAMEALERRGPFNVVARRVGARRWGELLRKRMDRNDRCAGSSSSSLYRRR